MDEQYINKITLEFLLNPLLQNKLNLINTYSNSVEDIEFYRRRIIQLTKEMIKGEYPNNELKKSFLTYTDDLIYYFKQLDAKDIYQKDYIDISFNTISNYIDTSYNVNDILTNIQKSKSNLDTFVNKLQTIPEEKIIPHKKEINIKDPSLRNKGIKKNNIA